MIDDRRELGAFGEALAAEGLVAAGWTVLDRNWRCRHGELDVVARDPDGALVFCEVKTRRSLRFGTPVEAVTPAKAARLRRLACLWLDAHRAEVGSVPAIRIDVLGVTVGAVGTPEVLHLRGVA